MLPWPRCPVIYEINAWVWLGELRRRYRKPLTLATVPEQEWDRLAARGFDAVWLMGVWERSPAGSDIAMQNAGLREDFRRALPDFAADDNVGSAYCVRRYVVDPHFGGPQALATARARLRERGLRLMLDFVPNHVAPDHPWVAAQPDYFIRGTADEARNDPAAFVEIGGTVFARGRDPCSPAWPDVLQLNAFAPQLRRAAIETLTEIAGQCDGVRCDMAMLMLNAIFARTWGARAGVTPDADYWPTVIAAIKGRSPGFRFVAEAYRDLEWELQRQGFDHCYDKQLYDHLEHGEAESVRQHLLADGADQDRMVRFIENHDEPRAAAAFGPEKGRAAAVAILTLPGARLLHEGQCEGARVRLPVFLGRRPAEPAQDDLAAFYARLLKATGRDVFRNGVWRLCERRGWPDNPSFLSILAWCWSQADERHLVVIHYGEGWAQARVNLPWNELSGRTWRLDDNLSGAVHERRGDEMREMGLFVELGPWQYHFFRLTAL